MTVAYPIAHAWLSTGGTGAQNYDEFADDAEITAIIADNPSSALAIEMPHRAPDNVGRSFHDSLPDAVARLQAAKDDGHYTAAADVVVLYRITAPDGARAYGLWCMVATDQISTSAEEPGAVIRNEDVFIEKVRERVALAEATQHLLSPVLLLQTAHGEALHTALAHACADAGTPVVTDVDPAGRSHEIWPVAAGTTRDRLLALAGGGELVVADGNHRSLAAQTAGYPRFLAVVTTPESVAIQPYNRLVAELPGDVTFGGTALDTAEIPATGGRVHLYTRDGAWAVELPRDPDGGVVGNLDHALVERRLFADTLGLDPGDKRITYVGGDYPASWLRGEVDAGRAELAVLIAPVTVDDFVAVNLARQKMPRKSTWFTPKARAGLVVAQLS
ncbi:DUF1015 family protein [Dactylosporangium aurantiacum]|uniref:DUF1015 family protein n=1 Tax=Dactylosporangium aurantiacum TaxID=35754 RepID=A0A9Q9MEX5_9ACTN|nr:DUF1015 family protein [Dactylosporangium aurantiacum]MDG6108229.1 DUF1015 family protein [Dactylosporangium aurantiacum]UWZ53784.1 DUF1015 family protein [Dactylosporangium aurantiacum]